MGAGLFYVKMPNSKKYFFSAGTHPFNPQYFGSTPKIKIQLPISTSPRYEVSRKVCHISVGQKLREEIDFLISSKHEKGCSIKI
jgi:hypothetical protein